MNIFMFLYSVAIKLLDILCIAIHMTESKEGSSIQDIDWSRTVSVVSGTFVFYRLIFFVPLV